MKTFLAFISSFVFVGLKAMQQRNVAHDNYWWIMPVSMSMAVVEVFIVAYVARTGWHWLLVTAVGAGSGLGCLAAMWFHKRFVMRRTK